MKKFYQLIAASIAIISGTLSAQNCNTVSSFPFKETFENDSQSRACWTQQVTGGVNASYDGFKYKKGSAGGVDYNVVSAHSGELNATPQIAAGATNPKIKLISPVMDVTGLQTPTVSFFYSQESWGIYQNFLNVYYRLSPTSEWKPLQSYLFNVPQWKQAVITLPEKSAQLQICFEAIMKTGRSNTLDDIVVGNSDSVENYPPICGLSTPSNNFETGTGDLSKLYIANEFNVPAHVDMTISDIIINTIDKGGIDSFDVAIMSVDGYGTPSATLEAYYNVQPNTVQDLSERDGYTFRKNTFNLPTPVMIHGGAVGARYWLVVKAVNKVAEIPSFWEATSIRNTGKQAYYSGDGSIWRETTGGYDGVYTLVASCVETNPLDEYCMPRFNFLMPIDNVKIGTINNPSTNNVGYEDFSALISDVERGKTIPITVNAQTYNNNSSQAITVYVDWNQNGYLGDEGEVYNIGKVFQVTGNTVTGQIAVPANAKLGNAKMRVISEFMDYATFSCSVFTQGQAEDYTLNVKESLAVSESASKAKAILFPNPAKEYVNIKNSAELTKAEVVDMTGRKVLESASKTIDVSQLPTGQYIIKMSFDNGSVETQKLIKK